MRQLLALLIVLAMVSNASSNKFGGAAGQEGTDALWVIITAFIIFTMQSGFGLLESGK